MSNTFRIVYAHSMVRPYFTKSYKFRKTAQNACDKLNVRYAKSGHGKKVFAVYSDAEYADAVRGKGEWKTSVCGGGKVWVELGTPACCDPSTETYWTM